VDDRGGDSGGIDKKVRALESAFLFLDIREGSNSDESDSSEEERVTPSTLARFLLNGVRSFFAPDGVTWKAAAESPRRTTVRASAR